MRIEPWHACILEHHDIAQSLKLIACMMRGKKNRLEKCADHYQIDVGDVKNCKKTRQVNDILRKYGKETAKVSFQGVPAVALDNVSLNAKEIHEI